MANRRSFLKKSAALFSITNLPQFVHSEEINAAIQYAQNSTPEILAADEDFWATIKSAYTASNTIINLNTFLLKVILTKYILLIFFE